jgi:competence protein ComGC
MNKFKKWWSEWWAEWAEIVLVVPLIISIFVVLAISPKALKKENSLQGEAQVGVIIINENQYRFDGLDAFKAATKEMRFGKYEHIIVDGIDYFILER